MDEDQPKIICPSFWQFPTSNLRDRAPPPPIKPSAHRAPIASRSLLRLSATVTTNYPTTVPTKYEVRPGVWTDGHHTLLAANHPDVESFLARARESLVLPTAPSEIIFVLAALDVFYRPNDPAHWLFWNDDRKYKTADIVTRISLHQPQLIHHRVAWNGSTEYLSILAIQHGPGWKQMFEKEEWYSFLVPQKNISNARVPNLRKRKPAQVDMSENTGLMDDDEEDIDLPPTKRARARRATSPRPPKPSSQTVEAKAATIHQVNKNNIDLSSTVEEVDCDVEPQFIEDMNNQTRQCGSEDATSRMTTRNQSRKAAQLSPVASEISASRSSSSTPVPSMGGINNLEPTSALHSRNRSTSQASAETLITSEHRRSQSVLSTVTAIERVTSRKSKIMRCDPDMDGSVSSDADIAPRVTRGSVRKSKTLSNKVDEDERSTNSEDEIEGAERYTKSKKMMKPNALKSKSKTRTIKRIRS